MTRKLAVSVYILILVSSLNIFKPFATKNVYADSLKTYLSEESLLLAYGNGFVGESHRSYRPFLTIIHLGFDAHRLLPSIFPVSNGRLTLYLEPQYNRVVKPAGNYEFGIGVGLEYRLTITNGLDGYFLLGSGLHYISFDSKYQSGGFNFNDNIGSGVYIHVGKCSAVNIGFRFRHISNADLNMPNEGINSYLFVAGYSVFLNR